VVMLSRRVRTDGRLCIRILKDAGRETAVTNTNFRIRGGATVRLYDGAAGIVYMCSVVSSMTSTCEGNSGEAMLCRPCRLRCWALVAL
jgi:hypothetical protein